MFTVTAVRHFSHTSPVRAATRVALSIFTDKNASKISVISALRRDAKLTELRDTLVTRNQDGAVILATPRLATWLEDKDFMADLLTALPIRIVSPDKVFPTVGVVAAVVDGLCPDKLGLQSREGLSICVVDQAKALPGLGARELPLAGGRSIKTATSDRKASITLAPYSSTSPGQLVTMPLANTLFANGRLSTLFTSRWWLSPRGNNTSPFKLSQAFEPASQTIRLPWSSPLSKHGDKMYSRVPLLPITYPRRIAARMGNILKGLQLGGKPLPPSAELEANIPKWLAVRDERRTTPHQQQPHVGPIDVWALIYPAHIILEDGPDKADQKPDMTRTVPTKYLRNLGGEDAPIKPDWGRELAYDISVEEVAAWQRSGNISALMRHGCRLHQVVSGGGGWGAKKGLLSLDPKITLEESDDDDAGLDAFMQNFQRNELIKTPVVGAKATSSDDICQPGDYVQFFVQGEFVPDEKSNLSLAQGSYFGIGHGEGDDSYGLLGGMDRGEDASSSSSSSSSPPITIVHDHFGGITNEALYLHPSAKADEDANLIKSKISVPLTYIWRPWKAPTYIFTVPQGKKRLHMGQARSRGRDDGVD